MRGLVAFECDDMRGISDSFVVRGGGGSGVEGREEENVFKLSYLLRP